MMRFSHIRKLNHNSRKLCTASLSSCSWKGGERLSSLIVEDQPRIKECIILPVSPIRSIKTYAVSMKRMDTITTDILNRTVREFSSRDDDATDTPDDDDTETTNDTDTTSNSSTTKELWKARYEVLKIFKNREGHCNVPYRHKENEVNLGYWVNVQRQNRKLGKLDDALIMQLETLGFVWDILDDKWNQMYEALIVHKNREGHCNVPNNHVENELKLGSWVITQRNLKKKGKLDDTRIVRLDQLDFVWDIYDDKWKQMYEALRCYSNRERHCNVSQHHEENGLKLGSWVKEQRRLKAKGKLDKNRITQLEKIGFVFDPSKKKWETIFLVLEKYVKREGHCKVPQNYVEGGVQLGTWLKTQLEMKSKGKLDPSREDWLRKLGVVFPEE